MKSFLFLLALGLASSDKLDRSYLPPPGSTFSGGSPGSLQVPLEYPKETYSTTLRPLTPGRKDNRLVTPEDSQLTVGINRGTGLQSGAPGNSQDFVPVTPGPKAPFTYFQNSYKVPTTTTSYAYTQTTTYPPSDGFETTLSPVGPTSFPDSPFNKIQKQTGINYPLNQGQSSLGHIQPGFVPGINVNGIPSGFGFQPQIPSGQAVIHGPTGLQQHPHNFNQYQQALPSSTVSPIHGINAQSPGFTQSPYDHNQSFTPHLGVQPPKQLIGQPGIPSTVAPQVIPNYQPGFQQFSQNPTQFIGQQSSFPSTIGLPNIPSNQPGSLQFESYPYSQGNFSPGSNIIQQQSQLQTQHPGQQNVFPTTVGPQRILSDSNQYGYSDSQGTIAPGSSIPQQFDGTFPSVSPQNIRINQPEQPQFGGNLNKGTIAPSQLTSGPPGIPSQKPGAEQYSGDLETIQGITSGSNIPKSNSFLQQGQPGSSNQLQQSYNQNQYQGYNVVPQIPSSTMRPTDSQNVYRPDSTATSSIIPPGYYNQSSYPSTTPTIPTYATTMDNVPSSVYPPIINQGLGLSQRPKRPQAESDRNAVILDYKNILTPEGFEYSFDTSNGIHADENGTAIDGVKAQGSYSYTGDDGKVYKVVYSADENGFRPQGDHLPTPPPIPKAIQRVIEQAAKDKDAGITDDGSYNDAKYGHKKYQGIRNRYQPQTQDRIITNGADIPDYYETRYPEDDHRKTGSQTTRKPILAPGDNISDEYDDEIIDSDRTIPNEGIVTKRPGHVPSRHPSDKQQEQDEYEYVEEEKNKMNTGKKATSSQTENIVPFDFNNNDFTRRRPTKPGRKQNIQGTKDRISGPQDIEEEFIDEPQEYGIAQNLAPNKNRPSSTQKPNINTGTEYIDIESDIQDLSDESLVPEKPKGSKHPGYSIINYGQESDTLDQELKKDNRHGISNEPSQSDYFEDYTKPGSTLSGRPKDNKRPGSSSNTRYNESVRPGRPGIHVTHDKVFEDDSTDMQQGQPTSGQNGQTSNNQHTSSIDIRYPHQIEEETGYQYNPPQNKFIQGETNRFPARFPEIKQASSNKRPSTQHGLAGKKTTTLQPFMTPNVYADDDDGSYEDTSDEYPSKEPIKSTGIKTTSAPTSQTDHEDFEPDQKIGDNLNTPSRTGKPGKIASSTTRQPFYENQTTIRPDFQYTPADKDGVKQKDTLGPVQRTENQNRGVNKNRRPEQRLGSTKKPSFPSVSSTTPKSYYTKETTQSPLPTTYETDAATSYLDTTGKPAKPGRPRVSGRPSLRPDSIYADRTTVPSSTTLRPVPSKLPGRATSVPMTEYSDETGVPISTTKKPVLYAVTPRPTSGYVDRTITPGSITIKPGRPTTISDYSDRNVTPDSITVRPITSSRISGTPDTIYAQNLPSTTYRPNYSFANTTNRLDRLGQPGQAGQAENLSQPDQREENIEKFVKPQSRRPGLTTDKFERPQPDQAGQSRHPGQHLNQFGRRQPTEQQQQAEQQLQSGQSVNQFVQPRPGQQGQQGQTIGQFGQPELGQLGQRGQQEQTVDQFGRPQSGQERQPGPTVDQFGRPQLGQPGVVGQSGQAEQPGHPGPSVDQFGRPQTGQPGLSGRPGQPGPSVDQFGRPQLGQLGLTGHPGQPGLSEDQFGLPGQAGRPGQPGPSVDQFGREQPGQPGLSGQPGQAGQPGQPGVSVDQFGRQQPGQTGQPSFARQPGQLGQTVDQFGGPQPGQERNPGQQEQSEQNVDQYGRPQQETGQQSRPDNQVQNVDQFGRLIPTSQAIGSTFRPDYSIPTRQPSTTFTDGTQSNQTPGLVTFKPTEPRFGGQGPNDNGLIKGQAPTYLGPYGGPTTTERVIGEDFSGPKQPQRFDPETGYHY